MDSPGFRFNGDALRRVREERGVTRQELARRASVSRAYVYALEGQGHDEDAQAARRPSYDVVVRLARALDVSPSQFTSEDRDYDGISFLRSTYCTDAAANESPQPLIEASERFNIPPEDVKQLGSFSFRGRVPKTASDWAYLWIAMRKSVGLDIQ